MVYYLKKDANNYVVDATCINPNLPDYQAVDLSEVPVDLACGYYTYVDNTLAIDPAKKAEINTNSLPPAI